MVDIRIRDLPTASPAASTDWVPIDNGTTRKTSIADLVEAGRPAASQAEAEAGTDPLKAMTPLTTKQAVDSYGLTKAGNLAGLADQSASRGNLGLGNAATLDVGITAGTVAAGDDTRIVNAVQASTFNTRAPALSANTMLVDDAAGTARETKTFPQIRNTLDVPVYVASRAALKALDTTNDTVAMLGEAGRGGTFNWRSGDFSALVAGDPQEGIYLKADAIAATAGAWVRQDGGWLFGEMQDAWFGAVDSTDTGTASANVTAMQAAINLRYQLRGGIVKVKGFRCINDFLAIPASVVLKGDIRHNVLLEFGDTTSGVAHPNTGTVIHTTGAGTARLWTDESGTGADTPITVAIAILGENAGVQNLTLQTPTDSTSWDVGIHLCGVSRGRYVGLDVRGAWKKSAFRFDATWSRTSTNMLASAFLPAWFNADYKTLYDIGLTNNYLEQCRFEGGGALAVEGGPNDALSTNGISDTVITACEFYNDQSATTKTTRTGVNGYLIRLNYRIPGLGGAQGLTFLGCRFDGASRWVFDFDYWSNVDLVHRCFAETSAAYIASQTADGVPTEQIRARIRTTTNTVSANSSDLLRFDGEFFCNLSTANVVGGDNAANVAPAAWVYRGEGGKRISMRNGSVIADANVTTDAENGATGYILRSWQADGKITFQKMAGNAVDSYAFIQDDTFSPGTAYNVTWGAGTITFQRNAVTWLSQNAASLLLPLVPADTTAAAANVNMNAANGNLRLSTSSITYKTDVETADFELSKRIVLESRPVWYRSKAAGDNPEFSHWGFIAEEVAAIDPRMVHYRNNKPDGVQYERYPVHLVALVQNLWDRVEELESRLK